MSEGNKSEEREYRLRVSGTVSLRDDYKSPKHPQEYFASHSLQYSIIECNRRPELKPKKSTVHVPMSVQQFQLLKKLVDSSDLEKPILSVRATIEYIVREDETEDKQGKLSLYH